MALALPGAKRPSGGQNAFDDSGPLALGIGHAVEDAFGNELRHVISRSSEVE